MMKKILYILIAVIAVGMMPQMALAKKEKAVKIHVSAKEEFRGAWIQTAWQERYAKMSPEQCQAYLKGLVDMLHKTGFNAIVFQVRPEGDAFYASEYEPWSRFLTGKQGKAPQPAWDPMDYLIKLCHERQMEFHAWINPYRMTMSKSVALDPQHIYNEHPEWFVRFDDKLYLNPGLPQSRAFIRAVIEDIVTRYDVDALHMDDYFYPYPVAGKTFNDKATFQQYAPLLKIDTESKDALGDFRRRNVDILIKSIHEDLRKLKPWVRFGISPFGIYRNKKSWEGGSETNGTQCFDDLYADVLLWAKSGWIDYVMPQIYWEIGHRLADYTTLAKWWNDNIPATCQLYIGQSIERSLDGTMATKLAQASALNNVRGNCFWYAYQVEENKFQIRDFLSSKGFAKPALLPSYEVMCKTEPGKVKSLKGEYDGKELRLSWTVADQDFKEGEKPHYFNVYRFAKGEKADINDCTHLVGQTCDQEFIDQNVEPDTKYTYVVTASNHYNNEGRGVKKAVKTKVKKK